MCSITGLCLLIVVGILKFRDIIGLSGIGKVLQIM